MAKIDTTCKGRLVVSKQVCEKFTQRAKIRPEKNSRIFHKARKMARIDAKIKGRLVLKMHKM